MAAPHKAAAPARNAVRVIACVLAGDSIRSVRKVRTPARAGRNTASLLHCFPRLERSHRAVAGVRIEADDLFGLRINHVLVLGKLLEPLPSEQARFLHVESA